MAEDQDLFASQSKDQPGETTPEGTIEWPDGRKLTPDQAKEEYLKLQSDYTKKSTELKQLKEVPATPTQEQMPETVKAELKKYGVIFKEDIEAERAQTRIDTELTNLENKIDGADGRPAFKKSEVLAHMQAKQIFDPNVAYEDLNKAKLQELAIKQYLEKKDGIPSAERGSTGGKVAPEAQPTGKLSDREFKDHLTQEIEKMMGGGTK